MIFYHVFPSTVTIYRLGESADSVVCYMHAVVCLVCMWGTWGLLPTIQAALFYVLWTCTCRKLFHNNSRQSSERRVSHQMILGKKIKKTPNTPQKKPNRRYSKTFPFLHILSSGSKKLYPFKKCQLSHTSEGLHGCNCNLNPVFCIMFNLATCEIYGTVDYTEAGFIWPTLTM